MQSYVNTQLIRAFSLSGEASSDAILALKALNRSAVTNPHFNHDTVTENSFLNRIEGSANLQALIDAQIFSESIDRMLAQKLAGR